MSKTITLGPGEMVCPNCGQIAESDIADVTVGVIVRGNYQCSACGWAAPEPPDYGIIEEDFL